MLSDNWSVFVPVCTKKLGIDMYSNFIDTVEHALVGIVFWRQNIYLLNIKSYKNSGEILSGAVLLVLFYLQESCLLSVLLNLIHRPP